MSKRPSGFEFAVRGKEVVITHHGKQATVLRGAKAIEFMTNVEAGDPQLLMARLTGNYKHGNERNAKNSPRRR